MFHVAFRGVSRNTMGNNLESNVFLIFLGGPMNANSAKVCVSDLALGGGTPKKAFLTALVVGTVLTIINHGDNILAGQFPPLLKVFLTYCVPYCVTTWGSCLGKLSQLRQQGDKGAVSLC